MVAEVSIEGFRREASGALSIELSQAAPSGRVTFTLVVKGAAWHGTADQEPPHEEPASRELAEDLFDDDLFIEHAMELFESRTSSPTSMSRIVA